MKSPIIEELHLPNAPSSLRLFWVSNLGSASGDSYRLALRSELHHLLEREGFTPANSLMELEERPTHPHLNISLSHAQQNSVIAWTDKSLRVGVDIEDLARLQDDIIKRVSSPTELTKAPQPLYIWSAKEAALKALYPAAKTISSVEIVDWTFSSPETSQDQWRFEVHFQKSPMGFGEFCLKMNHSLALFTSPS